MEDKRRTYGDETMLEVTPIEMHLSSAWDLRTPITGILHSKFERVQNYLFEIEGERQMFTIMREGNTLLPDSMILSNIDYDKIKDLREFYMTKRQRKHCSSPSSCSLNRLSLDKFKIEQLEQKICWMNEFIEHSARKTDFERLPKRYTKSLCSFIVGMMENDLSNVETSFLGLVGAGKGLTPAADDAMIGALAGILFGLTLKEEENKYFERVKIVLPHLIEKNMTTEISMKYLKCACRGDFSKILCNLIRALAGEESSDFVENLTQIAKTGHSSGMDMLYGLQKALHYIWQNREGEKWKVRH